MARSRPQRSTIDVAAAAQILAELPMRGVDWAAPSLDEALVAWADLLDPPANAVFAELTGAEFVSMRRADVLTEENLVADLAELVASARETREPAAVAMLRTLAVVAPEPVRPSAAEAADHLVAAGLPDPTWARDLGRPTVGRCYGYHTGCQEVVVLPFRYGRWAHAVAVLIDHDLGGGVKDCWFADHPTSLRNDIRIAAERSDHELVDYSPDEAKAIMDTALRHEPCPVEDDQVECIDNYLDLLRQRVALLANDEPLQDDEPPRSTAAQTPRQKRHATSTVHRMKITLRGSHPPIWRRLEVTSTVTLEELHGIILAAFGWGGHHLWVFETTHGDYGLADPELGHRSASTKTLTSVARRAGDKFRYTYDFGD
ncbi:MAG: plasmid pRiA4b ORF-3 family protein, partial [Sporichthyaceae bacterium]|nr:plasmid pRiA4b ORF-3 family protein [Sporichthyaceae bacterium]